MLNPSGNQGVSGSLTWYFNLYEPLVDLGHEVYFFNLKTFCEEEKLRFRSAMFKRRLSQVLPITFKAENKKKPFDLFFSYLTDLDIEEDALSQLSDVRLVKLNFSCNNTHQFYLVQKISRLFDFNLHSEKDASGLFEKSGARPIWFQMSANPNYYKPYNLDRTFDVTFIGMKYSRRAYYINYLLSNNINVQCFGPKWKPAKGLNFIKKEAKRTFWSLKCAYTMDLDKRIKYSSWISEYDFGNQLINKYPHALHSPVQDQEMIMLFSKSKINIGFLEVYGLDNQPGSPTRMHLHLREFEVPMSGGLYCTNYSDELSEFYIPDKEVIVFRNEYELADKIKFYLSHAKEAEKIREAGYRRAINDHTCHKRLSNLFKEIGLGR